MSDQGLQLPAARQSNGRWITSRRACRKIGALLAAALMLAASSAAQELTQTGQEPYPIPLAPRVPEDREVVTLASGIRYSVLHPGRSPDEGARPPRAGDFVHVHFTAWYADGRLCDSSVLRNQPAKTLVGKAIPGWNEILTLMTEGARWKVSLSREQCAGAEDAAPGLPATDALIFELELLEILYAPTFHAARPEATRVSPGGLKYEVLKPGIDAGPLDKKKILVIDYGLWTTSGTLLDSAARQGAMFEVKAAQIDSYFELEFMKEAVSLLRPGSRLRFEVPPEQCYGARENPGLPANSVTIWELELVRVREPRVLPPFRLPDAGNSRRTETGLLYEVLREGTGRKPVANGVVTAQYAIWLVDGTVFDASFERGEPIQLDLADPGMLPGIREALSLMSEGSVYRCRLSPDHGYGERGWPPYIGPHADLVVHIELIALK